MMTCHVTHHLFSWFCKGAVNGNDRAVTPWVGWKDCFTDYFFLNLFIGYVTIETRNKIFKTKTMAQLVNQFLPVMPLRSRTAAAARCLLPPKWVRPRGPYADLQQTSRELPRNHNTMKNKKTSEERGNLIRYKVPCVTS